MPRRFRLNNSTGVAILLLALMAALSFGAALRESAALDEIAHIGAGLSYVQKLDLRMNPEHPPLDKILTGISLALHGTRADYSGPAWTNATNFVGAFLGQWVFGEWVIGRWNSPASTLAWARFPMLLLTLALGWTVFVQARSLGGAWGGLLCLMVYVSTPLFLVFGPLVLTDIPIAFFSVLTLWAFASVWRQPERSAIWIFALCLTAALLSKFSAPILIIAILVSALTTRWIPLYDQPADKLERKAWRRLRWRASWKGIIWAALLVYAFYFIFSWNQPTDSLDRLGVNLPALFFRRLLFPPWLFLRGMFFVLFTLSRPTFLLGHAYSHGTWFYYPVILALKSPLAFLGLLALALTVASFYKKGERATGTVIPAELGMHWRVIWVSLVVFAAVCIVSHFDISVRHFSVPLSLLILLMAPVPRMLERMRGRLPPFAYRGGSVAIGLLAVSCLFSALRAYPWYFPFVSALGMGKPAYALMSDSNIDWNQALSQVKKFADSHRIRQLALDNYGIADATLFVPQSHLWDCQVPEPADAGQWVVVSSNMIEDAHNCLWLMQYRHEELAGGSMYAVQLPAQIPTAGARGGPPLPKDRRVFLDAPFDFRAMFLKVTRHPETIPDVVKRMEEQYSRARKQPPSERRVK